MSDIRQGSDKAQGPAQGDRAALYDLCVIGAGISGLNELFVAAQYLPPTARVALVDRNPVPGGMWTRTYDYVRLHQPHPMFTVGDLTWKSGHPPGYLARGDEVQGHLADCLAQLRGRFRLDEFFEVACTAVEEVTCDDGAEAIVQCQPLGTSAEVPAQLRAKRVIQAAGWDVPELDPLTLGSDLVVSTTPERLEQDDRDPSAPVVVVGGGKTGMDTAQMLIRRYPGRSVTVLTGRGTLFASRDLMFPEGPARWWRGYMIGAITSDICMRFDGRNTDEVFEHFRRRYSVSPDGRGNQYLFASMSRAEAAEIAAGAEALLPGYLSHVETGQDGPDMVFRDGTRRAVAAGTVFVNCTGHMLRHDRPYQPFISPGGAVMTVTFRSSIYSLTGTAAYFMTHVFMMGKLKELPLYELDMDKLFTADRKLFFPVCLTHSFYNMLVIMQSVPLSVFSHCGLDINRWYPLPRRLLSFARLKLNQARYLEHCRSSLDRVREDLSIRCGPIGHGKD